MTQRLFAAIDVGSFEIAIKIFEISAKGVKEIDHARHRIELGTDTYKNGKISYERMEELCHVLLGFKKIMETYQVSEYRAYATSAVRETENTRIVLDQIRLRTGLVVKVASNAEQRFLNYKSVALDTERFNRVISEGTAFLDIGGGSTQISIFVDSKLVITQNLSLGALRIREQLAALQPRTIHYEQLVEELIDNEMHIFKKQYLKDVVIKNIIVVDDYISYIMNRIGGGIDLNMVTGEQFVDFVSRVKSESPEQFAKEIGLPPENSTLLLPSALLINHFVESTGAKLLWMPGTSLSDGIAYDYAQEKGLMKSGHDFEADIFSSARTISKRYRGSRSRGETLMKVCLAIFDSMKKLHGMGARDRVLLQLACILRDCGKFISTKAPGECAQNIILNTEIIGISQKERAIVAQAVKNSYQKFLYYDELVNAGEIEEDGYLVVAKLTAVMLLASGLAQSKKKPLESVKASVKDGDLIVTVESAYDLTLEKSFFEDRSGFFEEVYGLRPIIRGKKCQR